MRWEWLSPFPIEILSKNNHFCTFYVNHIQPTQWYTEGEGQRGSGLRHPPSICIGGFHPFKILVIWQPSCKSRSWPKASAHRWSHPKVGIETWHHCTGATVHDLYTTTSSSTVQSVLFSYRICLLLLHLDFIVNTVSFLLSLTFSLLPQEEQKTNGLGNHIQGSGF